MKAALHALCHMITSNWLKTDLRCDTPPPNPQIFLLPFTPRRLIIRNLHPMNTERIDMQIMAINLDAHALQMAILEMLSKHLKIPLPDLRHELAELRDKAMKLLISQLENANPAFAAELSAIEERTVLTSSIGAN
jgi:hypothetical protein